MKGTAKICETCAHWRASDKGFFGPVVDRSIRGYCRRNCLVTFHSGHCGLHAKPDRSIVDKCVSEVDRVFSVPVM